MSYVRLTKYNFYQRLVRKIFSFFNLKQSIFIWNMIPKLNNDFILLNKCNFNIYNHLLFKKNFKLFKDNLEFKFEVFEKKILNDIIKDTLQKKKVFDLGNLNLVGPLQSDFDLEAYDYFITMKKNNKIREEKTIIFPNHIYNSKTTLSNKYFKKINFVSNVNKLTKSDDHIDVPYPNSSTKISSPMALQRIIFFFIKYVDFDRLYVSGFNLYSGRAYNRKVYPTLINLSNEKKEVAVSLINHGVLLNWEYIKYFKNNFEFDDTLKIILNNRDDYMKKIYKVFWS